MHTRFLEEKEITSRARKVCEDVQNICSAGDAFTTIGKHSDPVQTLIMRRGFNGDGLITPIIESSAIQAEKKSAGAGETFLRIFSESMLEDISRKSIGLESDKEWEEILKHVLASSVPVRKSDIARVFTTGSEIHQKIIKDSLHILRAGDNVLVKKSAILSTRITRESGYKFNDLEIDNRFLQKGIWNRKDVKIILIDGIIEKISEIHHLLEEVSKNKKPSVIFCIDCLPDVMETLTKNYLMGNLDTILVKVPVTEFHVNTLADLGVIFGCEPAAAARGDTISSGILRQNIVSDRLTISKNQVSIENSDSRDRVSRHVSSLRKRIEEDINLIHILEPRIRSLSTSVTRIDVGIEDQKTDPNIIESLDRTFRLLPKLLSFGFIEKNDFKGFSSSKICLLFERKDVVPAEMASQAIKIFLSTRSSIRSAAAGIESI